MGRNSKLSAKEYVEQFSHPAVRRLLQVVPAEYQASSLLFTLATFNKGDGGHPKGGSLPLVARMEKTFRDLGGTLLLSTKVEKVDIQNGVATGVILKDKTITADAVIVAQETIAASNQLFDVPLQAPWLTHVCENAKSMVCTFVCLGIKTKLPGIIPGWELNTPITYAGKTVKTLAFHSYSGEDYSPDGCSTLTTGFMEDTYDFWKKAKEEGRYADEKQALAEQVIARLNEKYPETVGMVEVVDVSTPLTYERYTGAYRGAWMTPIGAAEKMQNHLGVIDNVQGLYFAGHRLSPPGGLPAAATSGRDAAQLVCRQFGVMFS
jgi:phytoene dehydrogenase-like protein